MNSNMNSEPCGAGHGDKRDVESGSLSKAHKSWKALFREPVFGPLEKRRIIPGIVLVLGIFMIYLKTLCPTVPPKDSGELITAAYCLGVAHMPGYPLYVILGKLFSYLPAGTIAWRLNFMSAFFNSLTLFIFYLFMLRATGRIFPSITSCVALGMSYIFWFYSIVAEVFALNNFFIALILYLAFDWREKALEGDPGFKRVCLIAFLAGLSMANQQTIILIFPSLFFVILSVRKEILLLSRSFFPLIGFGILGLSLYLFLPISSHFDPYIDWGNPEDLKSMLGCILRSDYGTFSLTKTIAPVKPGIISLISQVAMFFELSSEYMSLPCLGIALPGVLWLLRRRRALAVALLPGLFFTGPFFIFMSGMGNSYLGRAILGKFMNAPCIFWAFLIGFGFCDIQDWMEKSPYIRKPAIGKSLKAAIMAIFFTGLFLQNMAPMKIIGSSIAGDYGLNVFDTLPRDAIYITTGDTPLFTAWYLQGVEGMRTDVRIISLSQFSWRALETVERYPEIFGLERLPKEKMREKAREELKKYGGPEDFVVSIFKRNIDRYPIYLDTNARMESRALLLNMVPHGVVFNVSRESEPSSKLRFVTGHKDIWKTYRMKSLALAEESREQMIQEFTFIYAEAHNFTGFIYGINGLYEEAEHEFIEALKIRPHFPQAIHNLEHARQEKKGR